MLLLCGLKELCRFMWNPRKQSADVKFAFSPLSWAHFHVQGKLSRAKAGELSLSHWNYSWKHQLGWKCKVKEKKKLCWKTNVKKKPNENGRGAPLKRLRHALVRRCLLMVIVIFVPRSTPFYPPRLVDACSFVCLLM